MSARRVPARSLSTLRDNARRCIEEPGRCPDYPPCSVLLSMIEEIERGRDPKGHAAMRGRASRTAAMDRPPADLAGAMLDEAWSAP